jgi:hypothetical protein
LRREEMVGARKVDRILFSGELVFGNNNLESCQQVYSAKNLAPFFLTRSSFGFR